jgi:hypothetical protein
MGQYTTDPTLAQLAQNTKEEYELLKALFIGNEFFNEDIAVNIVKFTKIIDLI